MSYAIYNEKFRPSFSALVNKVNIKRKRFTDSLFLLFIEQLILSVSLCRYKTLFGTTCRVIHYITGMFLWCLCWLCHSLFDSPVTPMEVIHSVSKCVFGEVITNVSASRGWEVMSCVLGVTVLVPFLVTMETYSL